MNFKTALVNRGWNPKGQILANLMPWVGEASHIHRTNSYQSNNLYAIKHQLDNMQASGVDGVILTWRGVTEAGGWDQDVASKIAFECVGRGMLFSYMLDPNLLKYRPDPTLSIEQEIINNLNAPSVRDVFNSGAYLPEGFVFDFLTDFQVNWATVQAGIKESISPLKRHVNYSWPCFDPISIVAADHMNSGMKVPAVAYGFNDSGCPLPYGVTDITKMTGRDWSQSVWQGNDPSKIDPKTGKNFPSQPARVNHPNGGKYFMDCIDSIIASPSATAAPYCAIVTWNDYDEGTNVEDHIVGLTGIRI